MRRPLQRMGGHDRAPGLIGEQIDRVGGVVPEQMVGPTARLAERVRVGAPEEVRLHVHLLDRVVAGLDPLVHPLMTRIEAAGVAAHRDEAGLLLDRHDRFTVGQVVAQRDLDLHVLAGRIVAMLCSAWSAVGVASTTASMSPIASTSARSVVACSTPYSSANARVRSSSLPTTATTSTPSMFRMASMCLAPNAPAPARATLIAVSCQFSRIRLPTAVLLAGTW